MSAIFGFGKRKKLNADASAVVNQDQDYSQEKVPASIAKCQELAKGIFHESSDIVIQTFQTAIKDALVVYVDGLVNKDLLDRDFIMPLKSREFDGEIALAIKSHGDSRILCGL